MKALSIIFNYLLKDEINSFEETFDVEFPKEATVEEQIKFVRDVEGEDTPLETLDELNLHHILYYLLLSQLEQQKIKAHLEEVQDFLSYFKDKDIDLPNTFNGRDDISGRNRNLLN